MAPSADNDLWLPRLPQGSGPLYLALAQAIAQDIASGRLKAGDRLPAQRVLAERLGLDFTTIGRAYNEARKKGHLAAAPGRGTFVRAPAPPQLERETDLSMNMPPRFEDEALSQRLWSSINTLRGSGLEMLLRYQKPEGDPQDREAACRWLQTLRPEAKPEQIALAPGAQGATFGILSLLTKAGDTVACESLTYPGFLSSAARLGLRLAPIAIDEDGLCLTSAEAVFAQERPKALYCTPTLHNPTSRSLSPARRAALADLAQRYNVTLIEDDAYGRLPSKAIAPLSAYAPERSYYIATLSKALAPALRLAYIVAPDAARAARLAASLRSSATLAAPLSVNIASEWILSGLAEEVVEAIRGETAQRHALALKILGPQPQSSPESYHLWLPLQHRHMVHEQIERLRAIGLGAMPGDSFAAGENGPLGVRLSLGAPPTRADLERALRGAVDLLALDPALQSFTI